MSFPIEYMRHSAAMHQAGPIVPTVLPIAPDHSVDSLYTGPVGEVQTMSGAIDISQCQPQDLIEYRRKKSTTRRYGQIMQPHARRSKVTIFEFATGKTKTYSWRSVNILYLYRPMRPATAPQQLVPRAFLRERSFSGKKGATWCRFEMIEHASHRSLFRPSKVALT